MKIIYRILFINFFVVVLIVASASFAFYSIMYNVLTSQQSKFLLKSSNDFLLAYNETFQNTIDDFNKLSKSELFNEDVLELTDIDFILKEDNKNPNLISNVVVKQGVNLSKQIFTISNFIDDNPSAVIKRHTFSDGITVHYGRLLTDSFLNLIAQKINAQVAIITANTTLQVSNQSINQQNIYFLNRAYSSLLQRNKFEIHSDKEADIISTLCYVSSEVNENQNLNFLIFSTLNETTNLRSSIKNMFITVGIAGTLLSIILTFVFTHKMRNQLQLLNNATKLTKQGNFENKIEIKTVDEIGQLASAFNTMLGELEKHDRAVREYSDFIALINRNASLKEIADAALDKIIKTCGFAVGAIYAVQNGSISLIRSIGIKGKTTAEDFEFFETAIKKHEMMELNFERNFPVVSSGIISFEIKHMLVIPIIYNKQVIAILELGGLNKPSPDVKSYLSNIQDQLAIGLTNAFALVQLENLVTELRLLNEEYQKQNKQVKEQNESLMKLHEALKDKAHELEIQKLKAEESTKLKSQFLANMSHELRTPMNSVLGLTELILEESASLSLKTKERLEIVHRSGKRLMSLINDILDLSKIEAGKMELKSDDVLLEDIVLDVETSIKPLIVKKHLELRLKSEINLNRFVIIDRGKVTQVLINLLGNAVKFTEQGFVELKVTEEDHNKLRFDITDSGIGISSEDQKIIFDEFRQIDESNTRRYGGTGLGLSICRKIAGMLKGSLTVQSQPDSGSTFSFVVPFKPASGNKMLTKTASGEPVISKKKKQILVIDYDLDNREVVGQYLGSRGYSVIHADDIDSGIFLVKENKPSAIVLNLFLLIENSLKTLVELKSNPDMRDIPVILVSFVKDKKLGHGVNAFEYILKPISGNVLISSLNKLKNYTRNKIEKIVLVDEDPVEYERLKEILADNKISVRYIEDSISALNEIIRIKPDLVITSLFMDKINGLELSAEISNHRETMHIPVIVTVKEDIAADQISTLQHTVETLMLKSKSHAFDVLKVIRDRIRMDELSIYIEETINKQALSEFENVSEIDEQKLKDTEENSGKMYGDVLVVDDDADALFTLTEIVQSCNCNTYAAKNGFECIEALEENIPDLILMDIMMPEMDGFQTIKKIRENAKWRHIPVFAVTARAMLEDRQIILKNGFDDYITKPVNTGVISFKIEKLFSKLRTV